MENKYINYDNSLQVLNEGFFDFVKKMVARLFHSLFKAKKYEDLSDRLDKIEQIIKYGNAKINENTTHVAVNSINENIRRRSRVVEADDSSSKTPANDSSASDSSMGKSASEVDDVPVSSSPVKVNLNNINPNIPSFPGVPKKLVDALAAQLTSLKKSVPESKLLSDISKVRAGAKLPANYAQQLELVATNFLRKYSGGGIALPQPKKGENMSSAELNQWKDLLNKNKTMANMDSFKSISDSMKKVIDMYKQEFTTFLNEFNAREDRHIQQNKDGKASDSDIKFKADWNTKLNHKMNAIVDSCTDFIPVAINEYIIKSGIYKGALEYISKIIELLFANTTVVEVDNLLLSVNSKIENAEITENVIARSKNACLANLNSYLATIKNGVQQPPQNVAPQTNPQSTGAATQAPAQAASNEATAPAVATATPTAPPPTAAASATPRATAAVTPAVPTKQPSASAVQPQTKTPVQPTQQAAANPQQAAQSAGNQAAPSVDVQKKIDLVNSFISNVNKLTNVACTQSFIMFKKDDVYKTLSQIKGLDGKNLSQNSSFNDYITNKISKLVDNPYDNDGNMAISLLIMLYASDNKFTYTYSNAKGEKIKFV